MNKVIEDRQTFVFSVDIALLVAANTSRITNGINLRFAADKLILKSLAYKNLPGIVDVSDLVQIWCNLTNDNLIASFPNNGTVFQRHDEHFSLSNRYFQSGQIVFEFQQTGNPVPATNPIFYNPQAGIVQGGASHTNGTVSFTIEYLLSTPNKKNHYIY